MGLKKVANLDTFVRRTLRFRVVDWSMAPAFVPGEVIRATAWRSGASLPREGSVVICHDPENAGRKLLKRVERIDSSAKEPRLFLVGDNELRSRDSRHFGPLPPSHIVAIVDERDREKPGGSEKVALVG